MSASLGRAPIGVLGGTFDPVHNGHLRLALEVAQSLDLAEVRVVPCAQPPHRGQPGAGAGQRARWVRMATRNEPLLTLDDRELLRRGASYTVDTLISMRADWPDTPLCLIMGCDVFAGLASWRSWRTLFDYAHIILIERADSHVTLADEPAAELNARYSDDASVLGREPAGRIVCLTPPPQAVSASRIRDLLACGMSPRYLLPEAVLDDIMENHAYQPASTATAS